MAKILIVEDHSDTRELLRLMLEMDGYEIIEATEGEEGVRKAKQEAPDLILMDISLAGKINGREAASRLRADSRFDETIIVALTAHALNEDREQTLANGCDVYWTKPILDFPQFQSAIGEMLVVGRSRAGEIKQNLPKNGNGN